MTDLIQKAAAIEKLLNLEETIHSWEVKRDRREIVITLRHQTGAVMQYTIPASDPEFVYDNL